MSSEEVTFQPKRRTRRPKATLPERTGQGEPSPDPKDVIEADAPLTLPGRTLKDRITQYVAYRSAEPDLTNIEIAKRMGIQPHSLNCLISRAVKQGLLKFESPVARIEHEIVPMVLDNIVGFLKEGDKNVTLETAKATVFKTYLDAKGVQDGQNKTVLAIKLEMPDGEARVAIAGQILGVPKEE